MEFLLNSENNKSFEMKMKTVDLDSVIYYVT